MLSEITAQHRGMGSLATEAVTLRESSPFGGAAPRTTTLSPTDVTYRHWTLGLSFDFKIQ